MSEYTTRDWQNGKPCTEHNAPYCVPCFKAAAGPPSLDALRENIMRRIIGNSQGLQRSRRNFFQDSRQPQFAASCQLGKDNFLCVPIDFAIVGDDNTAYRASDEETRAILTREHMWDMSEPQWVRDVVENLVPDFSVEDIMLLREMQLFQ